MISDNIKISIGQRMRRMHFVPEEGRTSGCSSPRGADPIGSILPRMRGRTGCIRAQVTVRIFRRTVLLARLPIREIFCRYIGEEGGGGITDTRISDTPGRSDLLSGQAPTCTLGNEGGRNERPSEDERQISGDAPCG